MKKIAILGSTGSLGAQAVEVAERLSTSIRVVALSAHRNGRLLASQADRLGAGRVCLTDVRAAQDHAGTFSDTGIEFYRGPNGLVQMLQEGGYDLVLNSIVGSAGLEPTIMALRSGTTLALANKESLVAGGKLVMRISSESDAKIIPVDSEHSAIFQCLKGEDPAMLRRIILTASGGPFRDVSAGGLGKVTVEQALAHPTWSMGRKVTIDSATLMNKGLEVLEAHHLFGVDLDDIAVLIHPQSVVHSMVEMIDGSILAHLGVPDMRIPIQYAMTHPDRSENPADYVSLSRYGELAFQEVDRERFPCLDLAYRAGRLGRTYTAALNSSNEEAVQAFLGGRIKITDIPVVVERALESHNPLEGDSLDEIMAADRQARETSRNIIGEMEKYE